MTPIYTKETKAKCAFCKDLVFVFCDDIYSGDVLCSCVIFQDRGQAPWVNGEKLVCRRCGSNLNVNERTLIFEHP